MILISLKRNAMLAMKMNKYHDVWGRETLGKRDGPGLPRLRHLL